MARVRWFTAKWPATLRAISAKMKAAAFDEQSNDGFLIERTRDTLIEGLYIEKRLVEDVSIDPFGNEQKTNFVDYRKVTFRLTGEFPEIQISNGPRNIQSFASRLAAMNRFALAISPIDIDVIQWSEALSAVGELRTEVTAIQAGEIAFQNGVVGKLFLRGAEAQSVMKQLVKSRKHTIERVVLQVATERKPVSVQLCKDGAAIFGTSVSDGLVERVRESLRVAAAK